MEALAISAANLETLEHNLGAVAKELSGVVTNVNDVNNQVNKVEAQVSTLNNEVKNLVQEIRENTIITNARQSIMYNNAQIEKRYGYYDKVRRTTESLMDAIENSQISINSLYNLKQDLLLNNPNYWLANALAALTSWILNDKLNTEKEVNNALKKDSKKTSLFFCLINLELNRHSTSLNWLKKYLSEQNPKKLDKDFITVLDLVATGTFGNEAKEFTFKKINNWFEKLNSDKEIESNLSSIWQDYFINIKDNFLSLGVLDDYATNLSSLKEIASKTSTFNRLLEVFKQKLTMDSSNKKISEILNNLIYDYETKEQEYQKDNLKNRLIIECNGNREKAEKLYKAQEKLYNNEQDLLSLLSNIIINSKEYKLSNETQKIALSLMKNYIIKETTKLKNNIEEPEFNLDILNFITKTKNGSNKQEIYHDLNLFINKQFNEDDKDLILILLIINIIGIIGIFVTLHNQILSTILIIILILGNIILFAKLNNRTKLRNHEKNKLKKNYSALLEKIFAQITDYNNVILEDNNFYNQLITFLNSLNPNNYTHNNSERNINIGE